MVKVHGGDDDDGGGDDDDKKTHDMCNDRQQQWPDKLKLPITTQCNCWCIKQYYGIMMMSDAGLSLFCFVLYHMNSYSDDGNNDITIMEKHNDP